MFLKSDTTKLVELSPTRSTEPEFRLTLWQSGKELSSKKISLEEGVNMIISEGAGKLDDIFSSGLHNWTSKGRRVSHCFSYMEDQDDPGLDAIEFEKFLTKYYPARDTEQGLYFIKISPSGEETTVSLKDGLMWYFSFGRDL